LIQVTRFSATASAVEDKPVPRLKTFSVYRWNPEEKSSQPYMKKYEVDLNE